MPEQLCSYNQNKNNKYVGKYNFPPFPSSPAALVPIHKGHGAEIILVVMPEPGGPGHPIYLADHLTLLQFVGQIMPPHYHLPPWIFRPSTGSCLPHIAHMQLYIRMTALNICQI